MNIRPYRAADRDAVIALWQACGLTRPWNDPAGDITFCTGRPESTILVGEAQDGGRLIATVMVGHDGHRGWLYYLGVDPAAQKAGHGRAMVAAAESWLAARGVPKVMLMVRPENDRVRAFYAALGYIVEERLIFSRRLDGK